jgi:putative transposase
MDFIHDQLATGKKMRTLTVVDTFSRYVPVLDPRFSYRAEEVVRTLKRVCPRIGYHVIHAGPSRAVIGFRIL